MSKGTSLEVLFGSDSLLPILNSMISIDHARLLQFATDLAEEAGAIMRWYAHGVDQRVEVKQNATLLTVADTQINTLVIQRVNRAYPTHGVLGEEASVRVAGTKELWVCDPIDGTHGFTIGEPTATFSLAFVVEGVPVVAVTYDPFQDRMYSAVKGQGTFCGGQRLAVSQRKLDTAVIACPGNFKEVDRTIDLYRTLSGRGAQLRMFSGVVFKGNLIAEGKIDGLLFAYNGAHDIAAIKLIVEEAGGRVTDITGNEQRYDRPIRGAIVSNGGVHRDLLEAVQAFGVEMYVSAR